MGRMLRGERPRFQRNILSVIFLVYLCIFLFSIGRRHRPVHWVFPQKSISGFQEQILGKNLGVLAFHSW